MFPSRGGIWGLNCAPNTEGQGEKRCVGEAHVTNPPAALRPPSPARCLPRPSPPPVHRPSALSSGRGKATGGSGSLRWTAAKSRQRAPPRCPPTPALSRVRPGQKVQTHALIKHSHDFMGTPHFVLVRLPPRGAGGGTSSNACWLKW